MGGQQFGRHNIHLDMTGYNRVVDLDAENGLVTAESGIMWPRLIGELDRLQPGVSRPWVIREKQTGVDDVTLAGSLSANVHGRGLTHPPFVCDLESFDILTSDGRHRHCSRTENAELFSLAIGGYGLFGLVTHVTLRLVRRFKVRRQVDVIPVRQLEQEYQKQLRSGCLFGDCQYGIDLKCPPQEHLGVLACYQPVDDDTPLPEGQASLSGDGWAELYRLTRTDKPRAFNLYAQHYRQTNGQVYWSDTHQLAGDFVGHKAAVNPARGTEMITEVYLRPDEALAFLGSVRSDFAQHEVDMTYGTIRFIEQDTETFLPWARHRSVCVVCNLHVPHTPQGILHTRQSIRRLLDRVVEHGGSFYLTYHRWATREHVAASYPRIADFFRLKQKYDPAGRFQSDWYRHYGPMFRH